MELANQKKDMEREAMPVYMYVRIYAYENISILYVCMQACMYVDDFQPVELSRYSILGSDPE